MRKPNKRFALRHLSIAACVAAATLAIVSTASQAQFRGSRSMSMGQRMPGMGGDGGYHGPRGGGGGWRPGRGWGVPGIGIGVEIGPVEPEYYDPPPRRRARTAPPSRRAGIYVPPSSEQRFVENEVLLEFAANYSPQALGRLLRRHGLTQIESINFTLTNSTFVRARINNRRSVRTVLRQLAGEAAVRTGQPEFYFLTSQQSGADAPAADSGPAATIPGPTNATPKATPVVAAAGAVPAAGDPAQYALGKLHLNEAHRLANGDKVLVAVIDSGVDLGHPELQGVIAGSFDALGKPEQPHPHGTAIAGAIAAHARLMGAAPAARLLAIRAFGRYEKSAEAITSAILKGIEYAVTHDARVINMSFAGPTDPAMARFLSDAHKRGVVLVAASGNFGPKSPPQYPAADANVIAVSATDANDKIFKASNIGRHIALAAPGVDILLPAPNRDYQLTTGTSFSAAYVSGVAALVLQRAPQLKPNAVRDLLERTAKDLGPRGKDKQYGAGLVDAYRAIMALQSKTAGGPHEASSRSGKAR